VPCGVGENSVERRGGEFEVQTGAVDEIDEEPWDHVWFRNGTAVQVGIECGGERPEVQIRPDREPARPAVSRKTVFTSVGSKAGVLKLAWDWALVGDDEPAPMADRPGVRQMLQDRAHG
jgi:hypothetical protein